jgi:uncharacterized tellurite resistance protein B-like protein
MVGKPPSDDEDSGLLASLLDAMAGLESGGVAPAGEGPPSAPALTPRQVHVATAVVLIQMIRADSEIRQDEHRGLGRALRRVLALSEDESNLVVRLAEDEVRGNVPLQEAIALLDRHCPPDVKRKIVHCLWRVAYADAELAAHEEYLARKISEHLNLSTADLVETKLRAREEFFAEDM